VPFTLVFGTGNHKAQGKGWPNRKASVYSPLDPQLRDPTSFLGETWHEENIRSIRSGNHVPSKVIGEFRVRGIALHDGNYSIGEEKGVTGGVGGKRAPQRPHDRLYTRPLLTNGVALRVAWRS